MNRYTSPTNAGAPWTPQMDAELRALTSAANSVRDIAAAMGRTKVGVVARQQRLGIAVPVSAVRQ